MMTRFEPETHRLDSRTQPHRGRAIVSMAALLTALTLTGPVRAGEELYTATNLGVPEGADSVIGVRMNNAGHVAGWSSFSEPPMLRGWIWTPEDGFTVLPVPPGMPGDRYRAMDINDEGVVAGDGGFDSGLAWRYENGEYTITGNVDGLPIAYLGGINNLGDIAGTAKDASFGTPDRAWLDVNDGELINITPDFGGRGTDVNDAQQVSGYATSPFEAFRWDETGGVELLGTLDLDFSFGNAINEAGHVVGELLSASGNTSKPFIYTDANGMQAIPAPVTQFSPAVAINSDDHVVGTADVGGPDIGWLWTGGGSVTDLNSLFEGGGSTFNVLEARDINEAGQILVFGFDNSVPEFRTAILTPPAEPLPGDINGDGAVDVQDLLLLLGAWGESGVTEDLNGDGIVDVLDLLLLLDNWT